MSYLGEAIKEQRMRRSMSLQDVANKAQITKAHVYNLELGRSCNPCVSTLLGLAVALGIDPAVLAGLAFADLPEIVVKQTAPQ